MESIKIALKNSNFTINDEIYGQCNGTAVGSNFIVFANSSKDENSKNLS